MISKRLLKIASFINKDETVLDVGTDHCLLPIYLYDHHLCKKVMASDISKNVIENAQNTLDKYHIKDIKLYLTDGINNINEYYDCLVIAGMGTSTIISILDNKTLPNHIILSSNNDLPKLRKYMNSIGYKIDKEEVINDKDKYYDIISYKKGYEKLNKFKINYGISNNKKYYKYLYHKKKEIFKQSKNISLIKEIIILKFKSI